MINIIDYVHMDITLKRTIIVNLKESTFYDVMDSILLLSKNVANPTLFLIKNVLTSYTYNKELKKYIINSEFKPNQKETIDLFNTTIEKINQQRLEKYYKKSI
jgi:hypothetical protein